MKSRAEKFWIAVGIALFAVSAIGVSARDITAPPPPRESVTEWVNSSDQQEITALMSMLVPQRIVCRKLGYATIHQHIWDVMLAVAKSRDIKFQELAAWLTVHMPESERRKFCDGMKEHVDGINARFS